MQQLDNADMAKMAEVLDNRPSVHFSSKSVEWATPQWLFNLLNKIFRFDIDVCATAENAKVENYCGSGEKALDHDGLSFGWRGQGFSCCWMNCPYGREIGRWTAKALAESRQGCCVVGLLPARTDTEWWHRDVEGKAMVIRLRGRLKLGGAESGAPFPSVIAIWLPDLREP